MNDLDRRIEEALSTEDRELLSQYGEQGLFGQLGSLFEGKLGWFTAVTFVIGTIAVVVGVWAAWKAYQAPEALSMLRWLGLAWATFLTQIMLKLWSWMRMETNRTIREIKRLELQVAQLAAKR